VKVKAPRPCTLHNMQHEVEIRDEDYDAWKSGQGYIQDVLFYLKASDREILISGMCQEAWDKMFSDEECESDCDGSDHPGVFCK
jgi:hypothetical protein